MALDQVEPPSGERHVLAVHAWFAILFLQFDELRMEEVTHFCRHRQHEPIFAVRGAIRIAPCSPPTRSTGASRVTRSRSRIAV